jgi:hypothetical protein
MKAQMTGYVIHDKQHLKKGMIVEGELAKDMIYKGYAVEIKEPKQSKKEKKKDEE